LGKEGEILRVFELYLTLRGKGGLEFSQFKGGKNGPFGWKVIS